MTVHCKERAVAFISAEAHAVLFASPPRTSAQRLANGTRQGLLENALSDTTQRIIVESWLQSVAPDKYSQSEQIDLVTYNGRLCCFALA